MNEVMNVPIEPMPNYEPEDIPVTMTEEVNRAIKGMVWLTEADRGVIMLARGYAAAIDRVLMDPILGQNPEAITKALYLGPHLEKALNDLGGSPAARNEFTGDNKRPGKLTPAQERLREFQKRAEATRGGK